MAYIEAALYVPFGIPVWDDLAFKGRFSLGVFPFGNPSRSGATTSPVYIKVKLASRDGPLARSLVGGVINPLEGLWLNTT